MTVQNKVALLLPRAIRVVNIVISVCAIAYFLSFLGFINVSMSWMGYAAHFAWQFVFLIPQLFLLIPILIKEMKSQGTASRHFYFLLAIAAIVALGHFYTRTLLGAIES